MTFILLDLEWNDAYFPKIKGFVNEIVEFGAVKLDEDFREIDRFSRIVRSSITKRLSTRFRNLTGMTNEQMQNGIPFAQALAEYKAWAGQDTITLTWSNSDLYTLYHNCVYFTDDSKNAAIGRYADLQKYFQHELAQKGIPQKNQISLSNAAALFEIKITEEHLHRALDDSFIAAAILKKCYNKERMEPFIIDTDSDSYFEKLTFKPYYIKEIDSPLIDKSKLYFSCPICRNHAKRITGWKVRKPWFHTRVYCRNCEERFKAAVCFKRHFDHTQIKKKIFLPSEKKENPEITNKQQTPVKE